MVSMASKMEATRLNSELMPEFQSRRTYVTEIRNRPNSYYADQWLVGGGVFQFIWQFFGSRACRRRPRLFRERFNSPTAMRISWGRSIFRKMAIIYPP